MTMASRCLDKQRPPMMEGCEDEGEQASERGGNKGGDLSLNSLFLKDLIQPEETGLSLH